MNDLGPQVFGDKEAVSWASAGTWLVTESFQYLFLNIPGQSGYDAGTWQNQHRILGGVVIFLERASGLVLRDPGRYDK